MQPDERIALATQALKIGLEQREAQAWQEAAASFASALALFPREPEILYLSATVAAALGEYAQGVRWLGQALAVCPEEARYHAELAQTLRAMGRVEAARERFGAALSLDPDNAATRVNYGAFLQECGTIPEAIAEYRQVLARHPDLPEAHFNLAGALRESGEEAQAEAHYRATLRLKPDHDRAHYNLGILLQNAGRHREGVAGFSQAWILRPEYTRARWKMLLDLPVLIVDQAEIPQLRARWREGVNTLLEETRLTTPDQIREAWEAASAVSNFYLNYHGENDREEQRLFGRLLTRVAQAAFPAYADAASGRRQAGERLRVGFVSSFFHGHSIFKTHGRWVTGLDPERFERLVFHTGEKCDLSSRYLQERVESFRHLPPELSPKQLIAALAEANLDVLIYTDLGMDARLHPVSALRLAPLQCNGGGHPVTSGLETIDLFLSSQLMEPEGAQAHYTESLRLLPNLASCYPVPRVSLARDPEEFQPGAVNYVNLQSLFKLLPRHDALYPRIAREVPGSRFHFIGWTPSVTGAFRQRLRHAFAQWGLDAEAYCRILPRMAQEAFFGLARAADVILDGVDWSGNNSSLEALAFDAPIVTLPGPFFRSRHTYGILRRLGVLETVARDSEDYVALAVRLGRDREFRAAIRARLAAGKGVLYEDQSVPEALGALLAERVG
ncbi:MAG: tetratricopeptide repeat protein [Magnetococcales bacterium]|nr:tetratricopeptide repeat protein [Magnetococcales bacterium]